MLTVLSVLSASLSLSASTQAKEYVVSLSTTVPQSIEVQLIDENGNPAPTSTSINYELKPGPNGGQVLNADNIFKNYKVQVQSNVSGAIFEVKRSLTPLTTPGGLANAGLGDSIMTQLGVIGANCDETPVAPVRGQSNKPLELLPTQITAGDTLCETYVDHEYLYGLLPAGNYSSELKIAINPKL